MGAHNEIDVGSLVWVKGEIDQAIERARQCLGQFQQNTGDVSQLKFRVPTRIRCLARYRWLGWTASPVLREEIEALVGAYEKAESKSKAEGLAAIEQSVVDLGTIWKN